MTYDDNEGGDDDYVYDGVNVLGEYVNNIKEKHRKSYKAGSLDRNLEKN
jgi:hypothetical protein